MTSSNDQLVPVEQIDREAAADIWRDYIARTGEIIVERNMRKGGLDDGLPALLARHRLAALRTPPAVEPDEGLVSREDIIGQVQTMVIVGHATGEDVRQFLLSALRDHKVVPPATPPIRAQALEEAAVEDWELPEDIASAIRSIGKAEWGATARKSAEDHAADVANSVRLTAEHFGQTEPQPMHGLYVEGTETVICHTGTSPNSAVHAQALTGAWNWFHDRALKGGQGV